MGLWCVVMRPVRLDIRLRPRHAENWARTLGDHLAYDLQLPLLVGPVHSLVRLSRPKRAHPAKFAKLAALDLDPKLSLLPRCRADLLRRQRCGRKLESGEGFELEREAVCIVTWNVAASPRSQLPS